MSMQSHSPAAANVRSLALTAGQDLVGGLYKRHVWGRLGWLDIKRRYRRTTIGPFWTTLSLTAYVVAVGIVGAGLWHQDLRQYLPFLVSGMVAWLLASTIITDSCNLFVSGYSLFRNVTFEYSILAYALVWRHLLIFLHNIIVYILIVAILRPELFGPTALLAVPGIILVAINGVWIALLCGMFCLRFRDVTPLISSIIQISMLITPIFWPPETLVGDRKVLFVDINPLYHLVDLVRAPLLGKIPSTLSYIVMTSITVLGWSLAYFVFRHFRRRIAYWS